MVEVFLSCAWREDDHDEEQRTNESADAAHCLRQYNIMRAPKGARRALAACEA